MNIKQYQTNLKTPHKFEKKVLASYNNAYLTFFSSSLLSISFDLMCISLNLSSLAMRGGGMVSPWSTRGFTCSQTSWNGGALTAAAPLPLPPPPVLPLPYSLT